MMKKLLLFISFIIIIILFIHFTFDLFSYDQTQKKNYLAKSEKVAVVSDVPTKILKKRIIFYLL